MAAKTQEERSVQDSVPKVDDAVAVGENLEFQRRWWTFERVVWACFSIIVLCDVAGLLGRGPLAQAKQRSADGALSIHYERIERTSTPSTLTFRFGPGSVHEGRVQLYISQSVVKQLGAQRISPQPAVSVIGDDGLIYTFPVTGSTGMIEIGLEPAIPGVYGFTAAIPGGQPIKARVIVLP